MKYLLFLLLPIFSACTTTETVQVPPVTKIEYITKINIPAEFLQKCQPLPNSYPDKLDQILLEDLDIIQLYAECRTRQSRLVEAVQEVVK